MDKYDTFKHLNSIHSVLPWSVISCISVVHLSVVAGSVVVEMPHSVSTGGKVETLVAKITLFELLVEPHEL